MGAVRTPIAIVAIDAGAIQIALDNDASVPKGPVLLLTGLIGLVKD